MVEERKGRQRPKAPDWLTDSLPAPAPLKAPQSTTLRWIINSEKGRKNRKGHRCFCYCAMLSLLLLCQLLLLCCYCCCRRHYCHCKLGAWRREALVVNKYGGWVLSEIAIGDREGGKRGKRKRDRWEKQGRSELRCDNKQIIHSTTGMTCCCCCFSLSTNCARIFFNTATSSSSTSLSFSHWVV